MALLNNGFRQGSVGRLIGATLLDGTNRDCINQAWNQSGRMDNSAISEAYGSAGDLISYPDDLNHPYSWKMAQTAGRMAAYSSLIGQGTISANMILTVQGIAALSGSGDASATGGLIVQLLADLSGQGTISDADMKAFLLMVAAIGGEGTISAAISALAEMDAALTGSGVAEGTLTGTGAMSAAILAYGELTPEGIRDSIWNALAAQYTGAGTMGEKVNDAGAAGNPWAALLSANNDPATFGKLVQDLQNLVDELHKIQGLSAGNPMTVTPTSRTAADIDLTITGDGVTTTTVTRA